MPELARHAGELLGIDPHPMPTELEAVLREYDVKASLLAGSAEFRLYSGVCFMRD